LALGIFISADKKSDPIYDSFISKGLILLKSIKPVLNIEIHKRLDDKTRKDWNDFIKNHPEASVFQSPVYFDLLRSCAQYHPILLCSRQTDGKLVAVLLALSIRETRWVSAAISARILAVGGPLIAVEVAEKENISADILKSLVTYTGNRSLFIEFRNLCDVSEYQQAFSDAGFMFEPWLNLLTDTGIEELVWERMSSHKQKQVMRSLKAGVVVRPAENQEEVKAFYAILSGLYKNKIKKPLPSIEVFSALHSQSTLPGAGLILVIMLNGEVIGGMACLITSGKTMFEWYICGLDAEHPHIHPSVLLTWEALRYAANTKIPQFDFMGLGHPDKPYGVRDFKLQFGGKVLNYGRYYRVNNRFLFRLANMGYRTLAYLKLV